MIFMKDDEDIELPEGGEIINWWKTSLPQGQTKIKIW